MLMSRRDVPDLASVNISVHGPDRRNHRSAPSRSRGLPNANALIFLAHAAEVSVDQPELTQGGWVEDGGVVVEAAFADVLDVGAGDQVTLNGRSFRVADPDGRQVAVFADY
jgi:predicted lysophospholipase L1 biosynthesis ABC-type transport system permease subunit